MNSKFVERTTAPELATRLAELAATPMPADVSQVFNELKAVLEEKAQLDREEKADDYELDGWKKLVAALDKMPASFAKLNCTSSEERQRLALELLPREIDQNYLYSQGASPIVDFQRNPDATSCTQAKQWATSTGATFAKTEAKLLADREKEVTETKTARSAVVAALTKRQAELSKALETARSQSQPTRKVASQLLWYLIILVIFCLVMVLLIRLYSEKQQGEWIKSGQVIQSMTVIVLLFSILALGLSEVLKEETLGTLLGGIAGYVLSQGVGKAVAGDIRASVEAAQGSPGVGGVGAGRVDGSGSGGGGGGAGS